MRTLNNSRPACVAYEINVLLALCLCCMASNIEATEQSEPVMIAFVSVPPQAYIVERVGGDHVTVEVLVGPGQSPATFEPAPRQMTRLDEAQIYFRIGVPFENTLLPEIRAIYPDLKVCDLREGIELLEIEDGHHHRHEGDDRSVADESRHGGPTELDPHVWLDPNLVKIMARNTCDELCRLDSAHAGNYQRNRDTFVAELDSLRSRVAAILAPYKGKSFFVFHPAYGYFGQAFGLRQVAIEVDGKEPGAKELAALMERARADGAKVIFVQPQFSNKGAQAIADAIGATLVPIDPLARDYLDNLEQVAEAIAKGLDLE
ncbi:MAG: zinc ABC transporter substrate-binding protein [candidate division Zixibacteria bacterium]|nr:zinc ABC transporter substrate-binding protein [candidate division Zixibacteria bacterium]